MSVKIRLQRGGRTHHPVYSIVVADSRSARDSKFIERLGFFLPKARGADIAFSISEERLAYWVGVGAQVNQVIGRLLVKYNAGTPALRDAFKATKAKRIKAEEATKAFATKREAGKAAKEAKANEAAAAAEAAAAKAAAEAAAAAPAAAPAEESTPAT